MAQPLASPVSCSPLTHSFILYTFLACIQSPQHCASPGETLSSPRRGKAEHHPGFNNLASSPPRCYTLYPNKATIVLHLKFH